MGATLSSGPKGDYMVAGVSMDGRSEPCSYSARMVMVPEDEAAKFLRGGDAPYFMASSLILVGALQGLDDDCDGPFGDRLLDGPMDFGDEERPVKLTPELMVGSIASAISSADRLTSSPFSMDGGRRSMNPFGNRIDREFVVGCLSRSVEMAEEFLGEAASAVVRWMVSVPEVRDEWFLSVRERTSDGSFGSAGRTKAGVSTSMLSVPGIPPESMYQGISAPEDKER